MPLLLCPNDNASMRTVQRSGVEFDMCPTCRGVWLDRGELEKLLAAVRDDDEGPEGAPAFAPRPFRGDSYADRKEHYERRDTRKRSSIFDIFD